jgi:hypothetical protein
VPEVRLDVFDVNVILHQRAAGSATHLKCDLLEGFSVQQPERHGFLFGLLKRWLQEPFAEIVKPLSATAAVRKDKV